MHYRIVDWNKHYENSRSRAVRDLHWVSVPNRHDGEGYSIIMADGRAAEIFAAWVLIIQVASKCQSRGTLLRDDGTPLSFEAMAIKTRAKLEWFEYAIPKLMQVGWIERVTDEYQAGDGRVTGGHQASAEEEKRREEKEGDFFGSAARASLPATNVGENADFEISEPPPDSVAPPGPPPAHPPPAADAASAAEGGQNGKPAKRPKHDNTADLAAANAVTLSGIVPEEIHDLWAEWCLYRTRRATVGPKRVEWTQQAARMGARQIDDALKDLPPRMVADHIRSAIGGSWQGFHFSSLQRPQGKSASFAKDLYFP